MIVYSVQDDNADNGCGLTYYALQKDAFKDAKAASRSEYNDKWTDEDTGQGRSIEVQKIWLVNNNKKGCVAMLNNLWYADKTETIAVFERGKRLR